MPVMRCQGGVSCSHAGSVAGGPQERCAIHGALWQSDLLLRERPRRLVPVGVSMWLGCWVASRGYRRELAPRMRGPCSSPRPPPPHPSLPRPPLGRQSVPGAAGSSCDFTGGWPHETLPDAGEWIAGREYYGRASSV